MNDPEQQVSWAYMGYTWSAAGAIERLAASSEETPIEGF